MLFHAGKHEDLEGNSWPQNAHILLTRIDFNDKVMHLDLFRDRQQAKTAASDDSGTGEPIDWHLHQLVHGDVGFGKGVWLLLR